MTNSRRLLVDRVPVPSSGLSVLCVSSFNPQRVTKLRSGRLEFRLSTMYAAAFLKMVSKSLVSSGSVVKNLPASIGDVGLSAESGRSPGEGNGNPLQYSCLGSPMDRGAWRATVHGFAKELQDLAPKQ